MLDHIFRHRGVARSAVAVLTVGLSGLAVLAVDSNIRTAEAMTHVQASEAVSDHWDQVSLLIGVEYEALASYVRSRTDVGRRRLSAEIGSATTNLEWLERSAGPGRAATIQASYVSYTHSFRQVIAAGNPGGEAEVALDAELLALTMATVRDQSARAAALNRRELAGYLTQVKQQNATSGAAAIVLGTGDGALLVFCGLVLLGYQRRIEGQAQESNHRALHDSLTGLPNRALFADRLDGALQLAERRGGQVGLLLLDLDRFKEVNDTLGHQVGDSLLCTVAERLVRALRGSDTVARLGGDEFAILVQDVDSEDQALQAALRVLAILCGPVSLGDATVDVRGSIGVAIYPRHGRDATALLKNADIAMYIAKRGHRGASVYSVDTDHHTSERLVLAGELRRAIGAGELVLFYQPKVQSSTGSVCGVEALVRWQHPTRGLVQPDEFIPMAERSQLILQLTNCVIAMALEQLTEWVAAGLRLTVSVNIDAQSLLDPSFPDRMASLLEEAGAPAELVTLEITETAFISDGDAALTVLNRLRGLGVRLSLDDFGTGYSVMGYLQKMPLDELKIDRRFVTDLLGSRQDRAITRAVIDIAHALDMRVVGEGVEDAATLDALRLMNCDEVQGYFLCRPVPAPELMAWLAGRPHTRSSLNVTLKS